MQKFINNIGEENIYILIGIIIAIIIALLIIIIIEKISDKRESNELNYYRKEKKNKIKSKKIEEDVFGEENIVVHEEKKEVKIDAQPKIVDIPKKVEKEHTNLVYVTEEQTKEEAKKAIEEAAKKLVYEEQTEIIGPTFFEKVQEEQSIISYDELLNTNMHAVFEAEREIVEEGNEPITLDQIYEKDEPTKEEKLSVIDETNLVDDTYEIEEVSSNTIYEDNKDKFKPSDVISPVFGVKREVVYEKEYNELGETINIKELEVEIKRTEEFLKELKKLKNKLD